MAKKTAKKKATPSVRSLQNIIRDLEKKVSSMYTHQDYVYRLNRATEPLEKELQECRKEQNIAEKDIANQRWYIVWFREWIEIMLWWDKMLMEKYKTRTKNMESVEWDHFKWKY